MKFWNKIKRFFGKHEIDSAPLMIITKESEDSDVKEYTSIEDAITDLEKDPGVSAEKIDKLKASLQILKNKSTIKIRNGEIVK